MGKFFDLRNKESIEYKFLKKIYQKTFGLWSIKRYFVKNIGFYNGKKRLRLLTVDQSNKLIEDKLRSGKPFMLARYGSGELKNLFSEKEFQSLCNNAGFFPCKKSLLEGFRRVYLDSSRDIDILAVWNYLNNFLKKRKLIRKLKNIENIIPLDVAGGKRFRWLNALEGKKVLVIHPFKKTIEEQMKKRKSLGILPKLKSLEVIKSVQTHGGTTDERFKDWFEALDYMKKEIDKKDYDVALIGCGAYGLPLASHVKRKGKQSIHLGGGLQLLFGIKGKRWDDNPEVKYTKYWTSPLEEDKIENFKKVEGGCYW